MSVQITCTLPEASTAAQGRNWRELLVLSLTLMDWVQVSPASRETVTWTSSAPSEAPRRADQTATTYLPLGSDPPPTMGCWRGSQPKQEVPMLGTMFLPASKVAPQSLLRT